MTTYRSSMLLAVLTLLGLCLWGPQGTSANFCGVDSRPHPKGICGPKLINALHNLCFLLTQDYPDMFSRSMRKRSLSVKNIDHIPLDVLAEMNLPRQQYQQTTGSASVGSAESVRKLFLSLLPQDGAQQQRQQVQQRGLGSLKMPGGASLLQAAKRTQGSQEQEALPVAKRSMVCDCCYNLCSASTLAQYCP